jgi:glycosyltransferase involved in cell wall biosynthesis
MSNPGARRTGTAARRFVHFDGLYPDAFVPDSAWIREEGHLHLPPLDGLGELVLRGEFRRNPQARGIEAGSPGLVVEVGGKPVLFRRTFPEGPWEIRIPLPESSGDGGLTIGLKLTGVRLTNTLAWLGRLLAPGPFQGYRGQRRNRQLGLRTVSTPDGTAIFDFSRRQVPFSAEFFRRHARLGMNIVGFLKADLGLGESARAMVRAADAAGLPAALVPLKLNCLNRQGDETYAARLQEENPHGVNVLHIDPPVAGQVDHHHGPGFLRGRYNIGYFAWELPEFPDSWMPYCDLFDEVWCPSDFTREAIAGKSPKPVLTMPHAIEFLRPAAPRAVLRARFGLPDRDFLFLSLFDLNSYSARKNPQAAIEAFRRSGLGGRGARLVVKVHNAGANHADHLALKAAAETVPGMILLEGTLDRADITALEAACDCLVSLHRSEGFGLAIAECMYLGKPVISTDWSAPAEFVSVRNGCPVRAATVVLDRSYGPYARGSTWAEPDVGEAAAWMRSLAGDPALAARLGEAARATIEERFSPATIGARYRRRLESIATF